jgi:amino acid adenylation domain-containing protein/non-ribosomal peptide synthase protein (TIGR01720 family)
MTSGTVVWRPGAPLAYFVLNWPRRVLTMIIHHSICDDWSISVLLREVDAAYNGKQLENRPFRPLAEYIKANRARSERFWKTEFHDSHKASMTPFPPLPTAGYTPRPTERLEKTFDTHSGPTAGFTVNTKLRLAWAMVQSLYTGSEDTFFGTVNAGRGVPVPGVQEMSGPALATVPVRVQINPNHTVMEALDAVQGQWAATMQFEHVGLQRLMHLGPGPQAACRFQTLMSVEPRDGHQIHGVLSQHRSEQHTYDSYAVILLVRPSSRTVWLEARFDPAVIEVQQMERVLSQMAYIYQQIERKPNILLAEINTVSPEDRTELTRRNTSNISSSAPPLCVHQLIQQRASQQPLAVAINSWDGDISYQKLDDMSSELAVHLSQQSVGPGVFVPLCLGKTKWMAVAMLAVMKTGAAFTLLDPSYPTSRLLNMCQKINATVIVTLESQVPVASRLGVPTVVSMGNLNLEKNNSDSPPESASSPMDPIYAAFTSGSTGNPKCAIVNHAGFTASALAHSEPCHFTPQSRVLQFASPAFDLCILEHLSTLIMGGCLCIPSAADCHSNLTEAMNKFAVNVALLTPTVSRIVSPGSISTLKVLVFCGETVRASDVSRWEQHVEVRNAYGPAECSVIFSVQPHPRSEDPGNIGFSTGCVGWVVHPEDHCRLMPLGCPGELVIEGPIVGDGYLSDSEETARAFIEAPPWRREFAAIPTRLLYRTGDLVECTGDGSFRFIGRKDTQVKLHGQRLELADVEHHLHRSFPEARQAIADILRSSHESGHGDGRPKTLLVAFVCLPLSSSAEKEEHEESLFHPPNDEFRAACAIAESRLSETLPSFMVPAVFLPLSHMPQTKSGKADRRYLLGQAELLPWERIQEFRVTRGQPQMPSGEREEKLQQIWARTLNRAAHEIGINESFFRLGGDSVSAMQVAASCKTSGFNVTVADIFRHPTISKLAQKVQESRRNPQFLPKTVQEDPIDKLFHLSPIQQLFFEHVPDGHNKFTQEFLLRVTKPASSSKIRKAIEEIVTQHSMLRARFEQDSDGNWGQIVRRDVATSFHLHEHRISSIDNHDHLQKMFSASQSMLDIQHGPMFVVDVIETDGHEQYLGLMAHHLVIDMVSWRVLFQNLEDILSMDCPSQPVSMPFQQWCRLQKEYAAESLDPQTALSTNIPAAPLGYWGPPAIWESNTVGDAVEQSISISQETTQWILGPANDAFQTRPVEIIQTAVLYAFLLAFDNRPAPTIFSEGHGREPWGQHIDISQTVGWFTTIAPIFVRAKKGQNFAELLQLTKDSRRANPRNGWDYFATRYLHPEGMYYCQGHAQMEVLFNYLSLFQQLERPGALLQLQSIPDQDIIQPPSDLPRFALIDVTAKVVNGCLSVVFLYNKRLRHQDRLQKWAQLCLQTLEELPKTLQQDHQLTISDFPLLSLTTDGQLQDLLHQIPCQLKVPVSDIEDIYPCSPVQLGMWLSQVKNPRMYWSHIKWSIYPLSSVSVDIEKIKAAWRRVVDRHAILRTVFTDGTGRLSHPLQIVLRSTQVDVQVISQSESIAENEIPSLSDQFLMTQSLMNKKGQPPHHLKLTIQQDGEVSCDLTIHHMLVDGVTVQILLNDVYRAYDGQLEHSPAAGYSKYLRYLQGDHQTSSETYWKQYLEDVHPCIFPSLGIKVQGREQLTLKLVPFSFDIGRRLQSFCQHHGITISNLLQVAWGLLLRTYTGSESVCFGYLNSCRDIPVQNVREISGPMINLLICRLSLPGNAQVLSTLLENQDAYARSIEHQHFSLAEVMDSLNLSSQPLFNTAMSLQKESANLNPTYSSDINLGAAQGIDSTEVSCPSPVPVFNLGKGTH